MSSAELRLWEEGCALALVQEKGVPTLLQMLTWIRAARREEGQDLAEYALLIALVAMALLLVIGALAGGIGNIFNAARNVLVTNQLTT